jgi:hypothetical protein
MRDNKLRLAGLILAFQLFSFSAFQAADINKGYTFSSGEKNVTHTKLNNLVDLATINSSFITDKSVAAPVSADSFLYYSASGAGLRRATYDTMFLSNTNLIGGQNESTTPSTNFYALLQDSAGLFWRSSLNSLVFTNNALINGRTNWDTPNFTTTYFLAYDQGAYSKVTRSNLFYQASTVLTFTNLATHTAPTNLDALLIWDATAGTNRQTTLIGLQTNLPAATTFTNTDSFAFLSTVTNANNPFGTNNTLKRITLAQVQAYVTNTLTGGTNQIAYTNQLPVTFTSGESNLVTGSAIDVAHGLGGTPQSVRFVLVCKIAQKGYSIGDEVESAAWHTAGTTTSAGGANSTNVFLTMGSATPNIYDKGSASDSPVTAIDWRLKAYATYFR